MPKFRTIPPAPLRPSDDPSDVVKWWQDRLDKPLFVYFIQDGEDGAVKIGKAYNPGSRLAELQCGNPRKLTLRAVVLAHYATEERLHGQWWDYRVLGEWFGSGLRGKGQPDRYTVRGQGFVRIQPHDHPSVQDAILRLAGGTQSKQIDLALGGASTREITEIPFSIIKPPEEWLEVAARKAA